MRRLSRLLAGRTASTAAAIILGLIAAVAHSLALRGYQQWTVGSSEVESQLIRPELLALDVSLQTVSLFGKSQRTPAAGVAPIQVVSLSVEEGEPIDALAAVVTRLDELEVRAIVLDLPDLENLFQTRWTTAAFLRAKLAPEDAAGRAAIDAWASHAEEVLRRVAERRPVVFAFRTVNVSGPSHVSRLSKERWAALQEHAARPALDGARALGVTVASAPPASLLGTSLSAARHDIVDPDGRTRREAVALANGPESSRRVLPTLAVETARLSLGVAPEALRAERGNVFAGEHRLPLTADGFLLVDHRIRSKAWPSRSVLALARESSFKDAVAIVGLPRREDPISYPLSHATEPIVSHAEHLASAARSATGQGALHRLHNWDPSAANGFWQGFGPIATLLLATISGMLAILLPGYPRFRGEVGAVVAAATSAVLPGLVWTLVALVLLSRGVWIDVFYPVSASVAGALGTATVDFLSGGAERRQLRAMITRMLPAAVAERALQEPGILDLGGRMREVTVLFADIRGFTRFAEANPPERVVRVLQAYQTEMVRAIRLHGGTVDKLMGDGTMAFFGAPQDDPDHPAAAVRAGLAMLDAVKELNVKLKAEGIAEISIGIGIHSGPAVVGNMGTPEVISYTAIGDTVNVAARIEGLTKETGASLLVGDATFGRLGLNFVTREVGELAVRGRTAPVLVHEVLPAGGDISFGNLGSTGGGFPGT